MVPREVPSNRGRVSPSKPNWANAPEFLAYILRADSRALLGVRIGDFSGIACATPQKEINRKFSRFASEINGGDGRWIRPEGEIPEAIVSVTLKLEHPQFLIDISLGKSRRVR